MLVKKDQLNRHSYLKDPDFLDAALDFNYLDLSALLRNSFHRYAVDVLKSGRCQMLDRRTVEMAFAYALALFAAARQEEAGAQVSVHGPRPPGRTLTNTRIYDHLPLTNTTTHHVAAVSHGRGPGQTSPLDTESDHRHHQPRTPGLHTL